MKRSFVLTFILLCLFTLTAAIAEISLSDGTAASSGGMRYSFAWSAERYEQSAALPEKADLHLTLCRNEWESFQLLLKADAPDKAVTVEITPSREAKCVKWQAAIS